MAFHRRPVTMTCLMVTEEETSPIVRRINRIFETDVPTHSVML